MTSEELDLTHGIRVLVKINCAQIWLKFFFISDNDETPFSRDFILSKYFIFENIFSEISYLHFSTLNCIFLCEDSFS